MVLTLDLKTCSQEIHNSIKNAKSVAAPTGPKVSVVCTVRNGEKYLRRAFDSIKRLTYDNIEVIVQDAMSTDSTEKIVKEYGFEDGYVSEPDRGALDGFIKAAKRCTGEYIVPCWADDELLPHAIGWGVYMFKVYPSCNIIYGDQIIAGDGEPRLNKLYRWSLEDFFLQHFVPNFSSSFFRRESLVKLEEDLEVFDHDEYEFWLWLGARNNIHYQPQAVSVFYVHQDSNWKKPGYAIALKSGRLRAVKRFIDLNPCPGIFTATQAQGIESTYIFIIGHEIMCSDTAEQCLPMIQELEKVWEGDVRIEWIISALLKTIEGGSTKYCQAIINLMREVARKTAMKT
ncbi:MAG: glycosyltransferase [Rhodospirillales bacterium]|nr:glycosyltransferase [Rhodospirillales bacterium]